MTFRVLSFLRLLVWQHRDQAPVHRGDDADPHSQVPVLRSGANRLVLLGQGCDRIFPTNRGCLVLGGLSPQLKLLVLNLFVFVLWLGSRLAQWLSWKPASFYTGSRLCEQIKSALPDRRVGPGAGQALLPKNKGEDKRKWPQVPG